METTKVHLVWPIEINSDAYICVHSLALRGEKGKKLRLCLVVRER